MNTTSQVNSGSLQEMRALLDGALETSTKMRNQIYRHNDCCDRIKAIDTRGEYRASNNSFRDSHHIEAQFKSQMYNFGLSVLATSIFGSAINAAEEKLTVPVVSIDEFRERAIATGFTSPEPQWEVPIVEHTWTSQSYKIRKLVREFNEQTHADY